MSDFVQVFIGRSLETLEERIRRQMVVEAGKEASGVLFERVRAYIRRLAYRTGAAWTSTEEKFRAEGLRGIASTFIGVFYGKFFEYGTGRRGAASGVTPPRGYVYGERQGMAARYPAHLALRDARPAIIQVFEAHAARLK